MKNAIEGCKVKMKIINNRTNKNAVQKKSPSQFTPTNSLDIQAIFKHPTNGKALSIELNIKKNVET